MSRRAEDDALFGDIRVGPLFIVGGDQLRYVDEVAGNRELTGPGIDLHLACSFHGPLLLVIRTLLRQQLTNRLQFSFPF